MADNIRLDEGTGSSYAATDEVSSGIHVQKFKLLDGTTDSTNAAIVDSSGNLQVETTNPSITGTAGAPNSAILGVQGPTAPDAAIAAYPLTIGGRGSTAIPTAASADGDVVNGWYDLSGRLHVTNDVAGCIQWSHYSNEYTAAQTSQDLVAASGSTKFYVARLTIGTGGTTAGLVTIYFGTGAYSAGTSKTVFRGNFAPSATAYPGVVIGSGAAPFIISAASDALKITTSAAITVYVQVDYIRV